MIVDVKSEVYVYPEISGTVSGETKNFKITATAWAKVDSITPCGEIIMSDGDNDQTDILFRGDPINMKGLNRLKDEGGTELFKEYTELLHAVENKCVYHLIRSNRKKIVKLMKYKGEFKPVLRSEIDANEFLKRQLTVLIAKGKGIVLSHIRESQSLPPIASLADVAKNAGTIVTIDQLKEMLTLLS